MQQTILATRYMLKTIKTGYTIKIMIIYRCQLPLSKKLFKECWLFQRDVDNFYLKWVENIVIQF